MKTEKVNHGEAPMVISQSLSGTIFPTQVFILQISVLDLHTGSKGGPNG